MRNCEEKVYKVFGEVEVALYSPILFDDAIISFLTGIVQKKRCRTFKQNFCFALSLVVPVQLILKNIVMMVLLHFCASSHFAVFLQQSLLCNAIQTFSIQVCMYLCIPMENTN